MLPFREQRTGTMRAGERRLHATGDTNHGSTPMSLLGIFPTKQIELPSNSNKEEEQWKKLVRKPKPNSQHRKENPS